MSDKKKKKDPLEGYGWESGHHFIDDMVEGAKATYSAAKRTYNKWKNKPSTAEKIRRHDAAVKHKKKNTKNPEIKTIKSRGKTKQVRKYHNNEYREGE